MNSRDAILGRIREALRIAAPAPGQHDHNGGRHGLPTEPAGFRQWLPLVGATFEEQVALFAKNAAMLKAEFQRVADVAAAAAEVRRIAAENKWKQLATHSTPLTDAVTRDAGVAPFSTDQPYATAELEKCDGGVTACEALIAQTGSVLITSRSCGGRALSVLPPHHIVVASREQLVPDLSAAFELLRKKYDGDFPSCISFITGPSRTGDIERILVLGAHGPKRLTILLVG
jgi:L-lactate dehydrogenase complex protein LldG